MAIVSKAVMWLSNPSIMYIPKGIEITTHKDYLKLSPQFFWAVLLVFACTLPFQRQVKPVQGCGCQLPSKMPPILTLYTHYYLNTHTALRSQWASWKRGIYKPYIGSCKTSQYILTHNILNLHDKKMSFKHKTQVHKEWPYRKEWNRKISHSHQTFWFKLHIYILKALFKILPNI